MISKYSGGKNRQFDLHDQPIENTFCHKLPAQDLYRAMLKLGFKDISITSGWMDLCPKYAEWRALERDKAETAA